MVKIPHREIVKTLGLFLIVCVGIAIAQIRTPAFESPSLPDRLPAPQVHALPPQLARWQDPAQTGDYFDRVQALDFGYLVWSNFPIKVYVEPPTDKNRASAWVKQVVESVQEWGPYLPLQIVDRGEVADIQIVPQVPPLRQGQLRSRSGETHYELYVSHQGKAAVLAHRCLISLNPSQAGKYLPAVARHEFGHALGIWGHSPNDSDVMYFSQVRHPPPISAKDINTLKRIYEQPTQLGWALPSSQ